MNFDPSLIQINSHNAPINIQIDKGQTGVPPVNTSFAYGLELVGSCSIFPKEKIQTYAANQNANTSI